MTSAQHDSHVRTFALWRAVNTEPGFIHEVLRLLILRDALLREIAREITREVLGPDHPLRKLPKLRAVQ